MPTIIYMEVVMKPDITIDHVKDIGYNSDRLEGMKAVDRLLSVRELCELLNVPKTYIYWLTHQKKIPFIKMQGHLRFRRSTIDDWLKEQEVRNGCS
jgi:excisionase family DNA binding protein